MRHTKVVWDGAVVCYGNTDIDVRDTFEQEAEISKQRIAGLTFDKVYTSPLQRAAKLATYCGYPDAERDERLKEMNFGEWEGRPWAEIIVDEETSAFFDRYIYNPTPGGESQNDQFTRVRDFILEKKAEGLECILVFCHGGVINCVRALAGEVKLNEAFATIPDFGSLTVLDF